MLLTLPPLHFQGCFCMTEPTPTVQPSGNKIAYGSGWVLTLLVGVALTLSGVAKIMGGGPEMETELAKIGLKPEMMLPLAILELTCVAVFLIPQTTFLGAILLTGYMGGAICTHWRVGDPFIVQIIFGVVIWLAVALREPRIWQLVWR
jgi:uncharacterized membrane protein YphA (DoxX/SURF4 family)